MSRRHRCYTCGSSDDVERVGDRYACPRHARLAEFTRTRERDRKAEHASYHSRQRQRNLKGRS